MGNKKKISRGYVSSIDLIPEDLHAELVKALKERRRTQKEILDTFNASLKKRGCTPISRSSLNRYSKFVIEKNAIMSEAREVASAIVGKLGENKSDIGRTLIEIVQTLAFNLTTKEGLEVEDISTLALLYNA